MSSSLGVCVVAGSTGAIGSAVTAEFLRADISVGGLSRHSNAIVEADTPASVRYIHWGADVTDRDAVHLAFLGIRERLGSIRYLVYTPGIEPDMDVPLSEYSLPDWHKTIDTYVTGFLLCYQEAMKVLPPGGHLLAVSSAVTRFRNNDLPPLFLGHYAAAKAALNELCKWGRKEANQKKVLLSRFSPGAVDVPFHRNAPAYRKPAAMVPLQFLADRIVNAALTGTQTEEELLATADGIKIVSSL